MRNIPTASATLALFFASSLGFAAEDGKLMILVIGAHPDDAEYKAGGTAAKWAQLGHHV